MSEQYFDVIIVGAGLSGIGAAVHLAEKCPNKSFVILEGRKAMGGTWDLFRYPGIRSDSDMHTLGYKFKPWREAKAIADGPSILRYIQETAVEHNIDQHIRYSHMVTAADWSNTDQQWTLTADNNGTPVVIKGNFLFMCAGYYNYEQGYTPEFTGRDRFQGEIIHPQHWPETLDYRDKKVVVIGSGATAVTLIPAMAEQTAHITMLQRSPTYIVSMADEDKVANMLRRFLPEKLAYRITRWKNIVYSQFSYNMTRWRPRMMKRFMINGVKEELGPEFDVKKHFTPDYNPWDQRVCLVPNSDLFLALKSGKASVVTDHIESFTENGILLKSGETLNADMIITATGLNVTVLGGTKFSIDGRAIDFSDHYTYRGVMLSDIPNIVSVFGYTNASWTLRADLISEFVCRLLNLMDQKKAKQCTPRLQPADKEMSQRPWFDDFSSGYIQRVLHQLPKQGDHEPWTNPQNYSHDKRVFLRQSLDDGVLNFE